MPRLSTDDERRERDALRAHNVALDGILSILEPLLPDYSRDRAAEILALLVKTRGTIEAIQVKGDAERERRAANEDTP